MKNIVEPIKSKKDLERIEEFLENHSKRNRLIFAFGINTGLRVSDILGLNVEDVEGKSHVEIHEKKTGKYKRFPLNTKLKALIKDYLQNERCKNYALSENEPLFLGKKCAYRCNKTFCTGTTCLCSTDKGKRKPVIGTC